MPHLQILNSIEKQALEHIAASGSDEISKRAKTLLELNNGENQRNIVKKLGTAQQTVTNWQNQHIKVTESLAISSKALGKALNSLDVTSTQLLEQLKSLPELLRLLKVVAENTPNMSLRLEKLNQSLEQRKFLKIELTEEQLLQLNSLMCQI